MKNIIEYIIAWAIGLSLFFIIAGGGIWLFGSETTKKKYLPFYSSKSSTSTEEINGLTIKQINTLKTCIYLSKLDIYSDAESNEEVREMFETFRDLLEPFYEDYDNPFEFRKTKIGITETSSGQHVINVALQNCPEILTKLKKEGYGEIDYYIDNGKIKFRNEDERSTAILLSILFCGENYLKTRNLDISFKKFDYSGDGYRTYFIAECKEFCYLFERSGSSIYEMEQQDQEFIINKFKIKKEVRCLPTLKGGALI